MLNKFVAFLKDEEGATAVEYGLIIGLIAAIIIVGATLIGKNVEKKFSTVGAAVGTAG